MKYGKCLKREMIDEFRGDYLDYKRLKQALKGMTHGVDEKVDSDFMQAVHSELEARPLHLRLHLHFAVVRSLW